MSFQSDANATYVNGQAVDKNEVRSLWGMVDWVVSNGGKIFTNRAEAVSFGQDSLPAALGRIITLEGNYLVMRGQGQTEDDPLFETAPRWGVLVRIPNRALVESISNLGDVLALQTDTEASTAQLVVATIPAAQAHISLNAGQLLRFRWPFTNTGADPVITIGGTAYTIQRRLGGDLQPSDLVGGFRYTGYIYTNDPAIIRLSESVGASDINGLRGSLEAGSIIPLVNIGGTGNAITADLAAPAVAAGVTVTGSLSVRYIPAETNTNDAETDVTLHVSGDEPRILRTEDGGRLPAGYFVSGRAYTLDRRGGGGWRVSAGGTARADLTSVVGTSGTMRLTNIAGTGNDITADLGVPFAALSSIAKIEYIPTLANEEGQVYLSIGGGAQVQVFSLKGGGNLPAGYFTPGVSFILARRTAGWRVVNSNLDSTDIPSIQAQGGKIFSSVANAISYGQASLPASLGKIYIAYEGFLQIRSPSSQVSPLFETAPYWGVETQLASNYPISRFGLVQLTAPTLVDDTYTAAVAAASETQFLIGSASNNNKFLFTPNVNSPASPRLVVSTYSETAYPIVSKSGAQLPAGALKAGSTYILARVGWNVYRVLNEDAPEVPPNLVQRIGELEIGLVSETGAREVADDGIRADVAARDNARIADIAELQDRITSFESGTRIVGDWDASSGAFPAARPDASPIEAGDQWNVTGAGTVDGVSFAPGDILTALADGGGETYADTWSRRAGTATIAAQVSTTEPGVSVQHFLDYANYVFPSRAALLAVGIPMGVRTLSFRHGYLVLEVTRTDDPDQSCLMTADGALWAPKGRPTPIHFGAVGDKTPGVPATDDTVPVQAWLDWLKRNQACGWLPGGFWYQLTSVNLWSDKPFSIMGDGCRTCGFYVSNPDRRSAGLKTTHPITPSIRSMQIDLYDFMLSSDAGNKAPLYEHRFTSGLKMHRILFTAQGNWGTADHSYAVLSKCWNVDLSEITSWRGGVYFAPFEIPLNQRFNMTLGSDRITADGGDFAFTSAMEGKYLNLIGDGRGQAFLIAEVISPTEIRTEAVAEAGFPSARATFGHVRGTIAQGSDILVLEADVLTADDEGRRVYVHGADQDWQGQPLPLVTRVAAVNGPNITLDHEAGRSVALTELIFDPVFDFGDEKVGEVNEFTNDFKFKDLHIERYSGTALVATGTRTDGASMKLHGNAMNDGWEVHALQSGIQGYLYNWYGHLDGAFEQMSVGNDTGRIMITGNKSVCNFGFISAVLRYDFPAICMDLNADGALVNVEGIHHISGNATQELFRDALKVKGAGKITCGFIGGGGNSPQRPLENVGFSVPTVTVSTLPDPSKGPGPIYVSDAPGGSILAFSDGLHWLRSDDRSIVG
ncbi:hypothetical protein BDE18_0681 [Paracoccus pantotrophus]|uniref:Uncharacterized protein n=1 Tax=Paracoccus pantotrophus TaxID=82367 RepID=A0AAE6TV87_PARPN|nr:hypothetical protein [Paracoccus pantotrophus]QFG38068.1 hypothetical protein ESD82_18620 [Paracoccus pantotrophus]RKS51434.1 hypothetical protein BDE18_0681 [Paracoccus pantotrophus]